MLGLSKSNQQNKEKSHFKGVMFWCEFQIFYQLRRIIVKKNLVWSRSMYSSMKNVRNWCFSKLYGFDICSEAVGSTPIRVSCESFYGPPMNQQWPACQCLTGDRIVGKSFKNCLLWKRFIQICTIYISGRKQVYGIHIKHDNCELFMWREVQKYTCYLMKLTCSWEMFTKNHNFVTLSTNRMRSYLLTMILHQTLSIVWICLKPALHSFLH